MCLHITVHVFTHVFIADNQLKYHVGVLCVNDKRSGNYWEHNSEVKPNAALYWWFFIISHCQLERFGSWNSSLSGAFEAFQGHFKYYGVSWKIPNRGSCWKLWVRKHAGLQSCSDLDVRCQPHPHRRLNPHKWLNWVYCRSAVPQWNGSDCTCTCLQVYTVHGRVIN